ncbi:conserved exported hypothetical protein [Agrobacterium genomosp. 13 str. CFBP 6927]|uniref:Uncharacterized protein n=1 Tax=Agrobacterium genomosp. 13 str. CFBP 6927 TaxID=1183428 RepID=A0ABM9VLI7_9HYPH|nr:conserved exported hypothetical protein [Agrobacterium genomosp. 13 str. CFBP 6927]
MRKLIAVAIACFSVDGLVTQAKANLEPIPGSITYGGQPNNVLSRSPIGSTFSHSFYDAMHREVHETYRLNADRTLEIRNRHYRNNN